MNTYQSASVDAYYNGFGYRFFVFTDPAKSNTADYYVSHEGGRWHKLNGVDAVPVEHLPFAVIYRGGPRNGQIDQPY